MLIVAHALVFSSIFLSFSQIYIEKVIILYPLKSVQHILTIIEPYKSLVECHRNRIHNTSHSHPLYICCKYVMVKNLKVLRKQIFPQMMEDVILRKDIVDPSDQSISVTS
jgi:hypothetical protein